MNPALMGGACAVAEDWPRCDAGLGLSPDSVGSEDAGRPLERKPAV